MDLKQLEYIIKIAEENNITRAAEKLFITQSALNQQLLRLEKELEAPLFHRERNNWSLTEAGTVYIENAHKILNIKKDTYNRIHDITSSQKGTLSVGFTSGRGIAMFTSVYPSFHQHYPEIVVEPLEMNVKKLQEKISAGTLDIAFLTLGPKNFTSDHYITIYSEEILLMIPKGHPLGTMAAPEGEPFAELDISNLRYEPFVLMNRDSTLRPIIDDIFQEAGVLPNVLFETTNNATVLTMIQTNLCCGLIPYYYIKKGHEGMACFSLPSHPSWDIVACYGKNRYLSKAAKDFIDLVCQLWKG